MPVAQRKSTGLTSSVAAVACQVPTRQSNTWLVLAQQSKPKGSFAGHPSAFERKEVKQALDKGARLKRFQVELHTSRARFQLRSVEATRVCS